MEVLNVRVTDYNRHRRIAFIVEDDNFDVDFWKRLADNRTRLTLTIESGEDEQIYTIDAGATDRG